MCGRVPSMSAMKEVSEAVRAPRGRVRGRVRVRVRGRGEW